MEGNVMRIILAATCAVAASVSVAQAQQKPATEPPDQDYMTRVMSAAPPLVVEAATIVRMENGTMKVLKKGDSPWTCMEAAGVPMCLDPNAMEWLNAWQTHGPPPTKTGFIYMMSGDTGASNTDPWATEKKPDNHWIQTGSHVMIVGPAAKTMTGYPRMTDPDPTKPYIMWPGSPYEHVMIPVQ
jgi:hypothetical protein